MSEPPDAEREVEEPPRAIEEGSDPSKEGMSLPHHARPRILPTQTGAVQLDNTKESHILTPTKSPAHNTETEHAPVQMPVPVITGTHPSPTVQTAGAPLDHILADGQSLTVERDMNDPIAGLAGVVPAVPPQKSRAIKVMEAIGELVHYDQTTNTHAATEDQAGAASGSVGVVQTYMQPVTQALTASGVVDTLKSGLSTFMEDIPWLMKGLDEVAKIHPFVAGAYTLAASTCTRMDVLSGVVIVFKAVYTMEMTRRQNDKRILTLYVSMKDMIAVLVQ